MSDAPPTFVASPEEAVANVIAADNPLPDTRPWDESNPDWWRLNVMHRIDMGGETAWVWLVNEYAASRRYRERRRVTA